jgi:hypothetical protein
VLDGWQKRQQTSEGDITVWSQLYPDAVGTGALTRLMPTLDLDIENEDAVRAIEEFVRTNHEEHGVILVRIGRPPRRAIPFRTDEPFKKIAVNLIAPNGSAEKIEFLGTGQQVAVAGPHPTTGQPYRWHGGELWQIAREELAYIREAEARQLVESAAELLCRDFGYRRTIERPRQGGNGHDAGAGGTADWQHLFDNIRDGHALHDSLRDLAAKLIKSGTSAGAVVNQLRALMEASTAPHDQRWLERYNSIPRLVSSAEAKFREPDEVTAPGETCSLDHCHAVFRKWLGEKYDIDTIDAVLAVTAAERLSGDPVWLMIISGSGNAKTETVQSVSKTGAHIVSTISSPGALLSATARKDKTKDATGGLLRKIGDHGVLVIKDVTSVLSQDRNTRAEVLAAFRELHDGRWVRTVGVDGGRTLTWEGRLVVIGACTTAWDAAYAVVAEMGDRFVYIRPDSSDNDTRLKGGKRALDNVGQEAAMREELANAVAGVIGGMDSARAGDVSEEEQENILAIANLITRARTGIERDYRGNVIDAHDPEMPTRFAKQLIMIKRGALSIGMSREAAVQLITRCAWDSIPKLRLQVLKDVAVYPNDDSAAIRKRVQKPRTTVDRTLQALHILGLLTCTEHKAVQALDDGKERTVTTYHYALADWIDADLLLERGESSDPTPCPEK